MDEERLHEAAFHGRLPEVKSILARNPKVNVNYQNQLGLSTLQNACAFGHDAIVSLLLIHPGIDPNLKNVFGRTPFWVACYTGHTGAARILLRDNRVLANEASETGDTPLWYVASTGNLELVRWFIASGRHVEIGDPGNKFNDAILGAKDVRSWHKAGVRFRKFQVAALLEEFRDDPERTRGRVRAEVDYYNKEAAVVFALVACLSDEFVRIRERASDGGGAKELPKTTLAGSGADVTREEQRVKARRFFNIARSLTRDLQMVLCHRVVGSWKLVIPENECKIVFRDLVTGLM